MKNGKQHAQIRKQVLSLDLKNNTSYRGDCPACGGRNSFSASNSSGVVKFYCFRASCQIRGRVARDITLIDAKEYFRKKTVVEEQTLELRQLVGWDRDISENTRVLDYLIANNCIEAYHLCQDKFFYDTVNDRVCFAEYNGINDFKLATGRSLKGEEPKWYKYIAYPGAVFTMRCRMTKDTGRLFIAEDCASACSLSRLGYSFALCGTSYDIVSLVRTIEATNKEHLVICLDKDAQLIAMRLKRDLEGVGRFKSVKIMNFSDDAKLLSENKLKEELLNA